MNESKMNEFNIDTKSLNSKKGIYFEQSRELDEIDIGHESYLYEIVLFGRIHTIAVGTHRKVPDLKHQYYIPVYLIHKGQVKAQIGAFQFESSEKNTKAQIQPFLDRTGDLDLNRFSDLILYHFADDAFFYDTHSEMSPAEINELESEYINRPTKEKGSDITESKEDQEEDSDLVLTEKDLKQKRVTANLSSSDEFLKSGIFEYDTTRKAVDTLLEETAEQSAKLRKEFKTEKGSDKGIWIEKFMQNREFNIVETSSNGDCFFDTVRIAFSQIGYITTIHKLRAILVNELTDEQYELYRSLYMSTLSEKEDIEKQMKTIVATVNQLKTRLQKTVDPTDRDKIIKSIKKISEEHSDLKKNKLISANNLLEDFKFMKNIDSIENLREFIKTPEYWADAWSISVLEEKLNVKLLIFAETAYTNGDNNSVFQCGNESSDNIPTPNFYIMTTYSGNHYRLISYKNKYIFKFSEIPYDVKVQVVIKCLEKNSGAFYKIQDFRNFKSKIGVPAEEGAKNEEEDESKSPMYTKDVIFMFYHKSNHVPKAGKGSNETISQSAILEYSDLNSPEKKDWRKKLDDYWTAQFTLDGSKWLSVEHYYQGSKFKKNNPDFTKLFSLDSGSDISKSVEDARTAGSKPSNKLRPANIKIDADFYGGRNDVERERAVYAKFSQNIDLRNILLATRRAKLMKYIVKSPPQTDFILMKVREKLKEETPSLEKG
jgi:predicted NAD-dependent protein-ADP-ribosyltransferase YbiA (DUF1768 family)